MNQTKKFSAQLDRSLLAAFACGMTLAGCGGGGGGAAVPSVVTVNLDAANVVQVLEGGGGTTTQLSFPVILSGPANGPLRVNYYTNLNSSIDDATGGTSCSDVGADYVTTTGFITIASGLSSGVINVQVCGDNVFEANEKLTMVLNSPGGNGILGSQVSLQGVIVNDDAGGLNDTGATACSDGAIALAVCPKASHPAQDAQHGRDSNSLTNSATDGYKGFSFTKVASDVCVQDNVTGLMWVANASGAYTRAAADTFVTDMNTALLCGSSDWRLPTPQELTSLVNNDGVAAGTARIDQSFFAGQPNGFYWTGVANSADNAAAWFVDFASGGVSFQNMASTAYVRLVRSTLAAPPSRYEAQADGTVKDKATGLHWRQCQDGLSGAGCSDGSAVAYTWQEALNRVAAVNQAGFAGYKDWRLPNRNELASIVDYSDNKPALDRTVFTGFTAGAATPSFWTSTPFSADGQLIWAVDFNDGYVAMRDRLTSLPLLLVRAGQ